MNKMEKKLVFSLDENYIFFRESVPVKHSVDQHVFLQYAHFDVCGRFPSRQWCCRLQNQLGFNFRSENGICFEL